MNKNALALILVITLTVIFCGWASYQWGYDVGEKERFKGWGTIHKVPVILPSENPIPKNDPYISDIYDMGYNKGLEDGIHKARTQLIIMPPSPEHAEYDEQILSGSSRTAPITRVNFITERSDSVLYKQLQAYHDRDDIEIVDIDMAYSGKYLVGYKITYYVKEGK